MLRFTDDELKQLREHPKDELLAIRIWAQAAERERLIYKQEPWSPEELTFTKTVHSVETNIRDLGTYFPAEHEVEKQLGAMRLSLMHVISELTDFRCAALDFWITLGKENREDLGQRWKVGRACFNASTAFSAYCELLRKFGKVSEEDLSSAFDDPGHYAVMKIFRNYLSHHGFIMPVPIEKIEYGPQGKRSLDFYLKEFNLILDEIETKYRGWAWQEALRYSQRNRHEINFRFILTDLLQNTGGTFHRCAAKLEQECDSSRLKQYREYKAFLEMRRHP